MNFNNRGKASFFKILLRDDIDRFPLPSVFAKKHLQKSNIKKQTVVLNIKWSVTYSKMNDKHYFMDGWLKFMTDNRLQMGVFLVFWLLSPSPNPVFQVYIYGPNGSLQHPTTSDDHAAPTNRKTPFVTEETTGDNDSSGTVQQKMTTRITEAYSYRMPMKNMFVKATGINGYRSVQLRNDEGKTWNVKLLTSRSHRITRMGAGWCAFRKHNKIKMGDTCEFYHVESNLLHVRVLTAEEGHIL